MTSTIRRCLATSMAMAGVMVAVIAVSPPDDPRRASAAVGDFVPLPAPQRLLDSRPGTTTADGLFAGIGVRPSGSVVELQVAGRVGVPDDAESVALNVTADAALEGGFVTVFACGSAVPNASNLNYAVGQTIANAVITRIGTDGTVCLYNFGATNLIADVTGYFPTDAFEPLSQPARLLDTRPGTATIDGQFAGIGVREARQHPGAPGRRAGRRARHGRCRRAERHCRRSQGRRVRHRVRLRRRVTDGVERQLRERTDDRQRRRHPRRRQWCGVLLHRRCHRPDRRRRRCVPRCDVEHLERAATTARHPARPVDVRWLVRRWRRAAG